MSYFIPKVTGLTVQGFKKSCDRKTLKVSVLEKISDALDLPMRFWWDNEDQMLLHKDSNEVQVLARENRNLEIRIDELVNDKRRLIRDNDELREKLGIGKVGS